MRAAFVETLVGLAERDHRIMLLTGDLGFMALEPFSDRFPDRFINAGVAEQNMVGVATGLAEAGFIPFVYSIATFASLRAYEFIRNGPVLHRLPVRIVGMGGGFEYGSAGMSHHALEDIGIMRAQPSLVVIAPADHQQTRTAVDSTWDLPGPIYYRLGKDDTSLVPGLHGRFTLGHADIVREGKDVLMVAMGSVTMEAAAAVERLATQGLECTLMVIASLEPPPNADIAAALTQVECVVTVEAHSAVGGVGSMVADVIADRGLHCRLERCAVTHSANGISGSQAYLHAVHGLSCDALVERVHRLMAEPARRV